MFYSIHVFSRAKFEMVIFHPQSKSYVEQAKMSKINNFLSLSFRLFFSLLKLIVENLKTNNFSTDALLYTFFLQRKIWVGNFSSTVKKIYDNMQKCLKMTIFLHFCGLTANWRNIEKTLNFTDALLNAWFYWEAFEKAIQYFATNSELYQKIQKCLEMTIFDHFHLFLGLLKLLGKTSKKHKTFHSWSIPCMFSAENNFRV